MKTYVLSSSPLFSASRPRFSSPLLRFIKGGLNILGPDKPKIFFEGGPDKPKKILGGELIFWKKKLRGGALRAFVPPSLLSLVQEHKMHQHST